MHFEMEERSRHFHTGGLPLQHAVAVVVHTHTHTHTQTAIQPLSLTWGGEAEDEGVVEKSEEKKKKKKNHQRCFAGDSTRTFRGVRELAPKFPVSPLKM